MGAVPILGQVASFVDGFLVDPLLRGRSPKFFIDDVKRFIGKVTMQ
jgi:hypothetical protein